MPIDKLPTDLSTQGAADILNVSRQYLTRLLDEGKLSFYCVGSHRRLRLADVLVFKEKRDKRRARELDKLVELTEEADGYSELK